MSAFSTALLPIMVLITMGYAIKRARFIEQSTWQGIEKITYYILLPSLLIRTLGSQNLNDMPWLDLLFISILILLISSLVIVLIYRLGLAGRKSTFTSIFQGGTRFNTYIVLAVAQSFFGLEGLELASVIVGFMIIPVNFLCVTAFLLAGKSQFKGVFEFIQQIAFNPLIIASMIGWFLSLTSIGLPGVVDNIFEIISRAALPFGLLAVGAALKLKSLKGHIQPILLSSIVKFGFMPFLGSFLISIMGFSGIHAGVIMLVLIVPTAPSAYILARQLGGDTDAMASIITFQTLGAFLFMPLWAWLLF